MRSSRWPAFLILLLSVFLLGPGPGGIHLITTAPSGTAPSPTAASAVWWDGLAAVRADHDTAQHWRHLAAGSPATPLPPALLPSTGRPPASTRPLTTTGRTHLPRQGPAARRAPARAPPSTTR